jgi:hypothetical protein
MIIQMKVQIVYYINLLLYYLGKHSILHSE